VYYLDFDLNVLEYRFSDNLTALHRRLFLEHLLDHSLTSHEMQSLGNVVKFAAAPDGNSPALERSWKFLVVEALGWTQVAGLHAAQIDYQFLQHHSGIHHPELQGVISGFGDGVGR